VTTSLIETGDRRYDEITKKSLISALKRSRFSDRITAKDVFREVTEISLDNIAESPGESHTLLEALVTIVF
jgi:hypothetical protein